jgi:F-type H+-transporting ATPase subunit b|mmetsp:Transcript_41635/g.70757  ORF Transcript_41635/g.70757 Transcript_41635/m.70757 type:complete len:178 (+) Transcript_41635:899-1432(+)
MEILDQTQLLTANSGSFSFNTDIFETNIINIAIFLVVLFIVGKNFLGNILSERQDTIINKVEDSEKRLNEATNRLTEAKKQLSQARVIIDEIKKETKLTKINLLNSDYTQAQNELDRRFNSATTTLKNRERLILSEIKQSISLLALKQVVSTIEKQTGNEATQIAYMQESIKMVGGM